MLVRDALLAVADFPFPRPLRQAGLERELVVSLTSFPPRYPTLALTLKSLLAQSTAPDRILLWIAHDDFARLPETVTSLQGDILQILPCDDLRSYGKLLPALAAFPDAHVVTADDDLFYPRDWLATLIETHRAHPAHIVCRRAHMAAFRRDGSIRRYNDWDYETRRERATGPNEALFPTGVGGVLYPAGSLPEETWDVAAIRTLCPYADDIWFFWMARRAGIGHVRTPGRFDIVDWPGSQTISLNSANVAAKGNDAQLAAMEAAFGFVGGKR